MRQKIEERKIVTTEVAPNTELGSRLFQLGDISDLCHIWNAQFQLMPLRLRVLSCLTTFQILRFVLKQQNVHIQIHMLWLLPII